MSQKADDNVLRGFPERERSLHTAGSRDIAKQYNLRRRLENNEKMGTERVKDYKRLTRQSVNNFKYCLKDHKAKIGEFNDYDAFFDYSMAVKRLGELEDKIESGELVEVPKGAVVLTPEERAEEMRLANKERKQAVIEFAERVKMAFYYEFDELIPSIMADKIDELVKEVCGE